MKNLKIYFTSDVHGYVYPTDYRDRNPKELGFLNMMSKFKKDGNTLIIDGGDTIQGSPFTTYLSSQSFDVHPLAEIMNSAGYDYVTLGNHDFNYGYEYLKKYVNYLNAKCLCTNVVDVTDSLNTYPYDIKTMENGLIVGVIGFTTDFIPVWERKENIIQFDIFDTMQSIKDCHDRLRKEVDILIGVYHGGFEYDLVSHSRLSSTSENIAYTICQQFNFDILLTGHQHMEISNQCINGTHIAQTPENGKKFVEVDITFDGKMIKEIKSTLQSPGHTYHTDMYNRLLELENSVQQWLDSPVGFLDQDLYPKSHIEMALNGSLLANFINQVQLEVSGADISCASFANSVKGFNKEVTVRDIVSTYIYPNTLVVLEVTGEQLLLALERCGSYFNNTNGNLTVSDSFLKPKVEHYNYDYFSNIQYAFDLTKAVGQRVLYAKHRNVDISQGHSYSLVMNNYRATGAGGYDFYKKAKRVKEIQIEMPEIIISYFQRHKRVVVDKTQYLGRPVV